jgi:hypothetical protein
MRTTKAEEIKGLIEDLNKLREKEGLIPLERCWTGLGHWLRESKIDGRSYGGIFVKDDEFIGFLEGLIFKSLPNKEDK